MAEVGRRIHGRGWISSTDGNFSIKLDEGRILTTPTGVHKGYLEEDDIIVVDMDGKRISGAREPSSELAMHLACYRQRPDIGAVIHAHPTFCIAFSVAGIPLAQCLLPEVVFTLGTIPTAEYAPPTTAEVPRSIEGPIREYDAVILERHGSLTVGKDIYSAYNTLERMEHVAEITYHTRALGSPRPLSTDQVNELLKIRNNLGLPQRKVACNDCNACGKLNTCSTAKPSAAPEIPPRAAKAPVEAPDRMVERAVRAAAIPNTSPELLDLITREVKAELARMGSN